MTPKERAAMQQALEALEIYGEHAKDCPQYPTYTRPQDYPKCDCGYEQAITALREALAEQAEQEPVAVVEITYGREPECYVTGNIDDFPEGVFKLYAAPVRTKDLTPHEITALILEGAADGGWQGFAQRVIAADRKLNGVEK